MEQWDAYTRDGQLAGETLTRRKQIPNGLYHLVCEVLVKHVDGSYLCMKRAVSKPEYPGYFEATAGGSALIGENKMQCIQRELEEETGILCDEFVEIGHKICDEEHCIFYSFICMVDCDKNSVALQENETEGYKWMTETEFINFVNSSDMIESQKKRYFHYFASLHYLK